MKLSSKQRQIFLITWMSYAGFYLCRKNLSIVLPALHPATGLGGIELANIVFGYTLFYVIGQFGCGVLSDRFGAKRVVGAGLLLAIGSNLLMSVHVSFLGLLIFSCLNGVGQSTGWSGLVKTMGIWFKGAHRGVVMAWWGTNYVLGGFVATAFATWAVTQHLLLPELGWRRGFLFPALVLMVITAVFLFALDGNSGKAALRPEASGAIEPIEAYRSNWTSLVELLRSRSLWAVSIS